MKTRRIKLVGASLTVTAAITLLAASAAREGWVYSLSVDQFMAAEHQRTPRVRLHGMVDEQQFEIDPINLVARFTLFGKAERLRVHYEGVLPDMFQPGHEVVIEGVLDSTGVFQADILMTKCASKYTAVSGKDPHKDLRSEGASI